ncbi:hypothetical protein BaRGS_00022676 [Batillaria attramentaria]|uniref:Uncharacterized protein n=1 Tax=Batillaria attramentaria TaxID=370345 RepID=A0ABD0KGQ8_9CAEN
MTSLLRETGVPKQFQPAVYVSSCLGKPSVNVSRQAECFKWILPRQTRRLFAQAPCRELRDAWSWGSTSPLTDCEDLKVERMTASNNSSTFHLSEELSRKRSQSLCQFEILTDT